jgi:hypothetical protein
MRRRSSCVAPAGGDVGTPTANGAASLGDFQVASRSEVAMTLTTGGVRFCEAEILASRALEVIELPSPQD